MAGHNTVSVPTPHPGLKSRKSVGCYLCGGDGEVLYKDLTDRLFKSGGSWNIMRCRNMDCGLLWLQPTPAANELAAAYRQYYTHRAPTTDPLRQAHAALFRASLQWRLGYQPRSRSSWPLYVLARLLPGGISELEAAAMFLPAPSAGGRLLDLGAGSGSFVARMTSFGWHAEGIDSDRTAVQAAQKLGRMVRLGDLTRLDYPDASFDAITMSHVIEHLHDPIAVLRECRRLLAPEGSLTLLTPNVEAWGHARFGSAWVHLDPPRHLMLFARNNLRQLLMKAGLHPVRLESSPRAARYTWSASREIQATGHVQPGARVRRELLGLPYQLLLRLRMTLRPWLGEELLCIAQPVTA